MVTVLPVDELTDEAFAPYGHVLDPDKTAPTMREDIFTFWGRLAELRIQGTTTVALLEVVPRGPEFSKLERHVQTEEVFYALDNDVIVLVGAPTPGQELPDPRTVRAFRLDAGKGVFLREGAWHWIPAPLQESARLLVIFRTGTPEEDLDIKDLHETREIRFRIAI